jgi:hypothetical protein
VVRAVIDVQSRDRVWLTGKSNLDVARIPDQEFVVVAVAGIAEDGGAMDTLVGHLLPADHGNLEGEGPQVAAGVEVATVHGEARSRGAKGHDVPRHGSCDLGLAGRAC